MTFVSIPQGVLNLSNIDKITYEIRTDVNRFNIIKHAGKTFQKTTNSLHGTRMHVEGGDTYHELRQNREVMLVARAESITTIFDPFDSDINVEPASGNLFLLKQLETIKPDIYEEVNYGVYIMFKSGETLVHEELLTSTSSKYNDDFTHQVQKVNVKGLEKQAEDYIYNLSNTSKPIPL